jgi:hypothetical protein
MVSPDLRGAQPVKGGGTPSPWAIMTLDGGAPADIQHAANAMRNAPSLLPLAGYNKRYGIYDWGESTGEALSSI